jgi:hypothetical protein
MAHSSGASRLGLLHRAAQPAWGGVGAAEGAGGDAVWLCAGPFGLGRISGRLLSDRSRGGRDRGDDNHHRQLCEFHRSVSMEG